MLFVECYINPMLKTCLGRTLGGCQNSYLNTMVFANLELNEKVSLNIPDIRTFECGKPEH